MKPGASLAAASQWTGPHKVGGPSESHRLGSLSLIFQAHRSSPPATQGLGRQLCDHSCPISSSPGPPSLQAAGLWLIKNGKKYPLNVFHFDFANTAFYRSSILSASIHSPLSFPIPVLPLGLSGPWSFAPVLQFSWSSSQKPTYFWPVVLGSLLDDLPLLS